MNRRTAQAIDALNYAIDILITGNSSVMLHYPSGIVDKLEERIAPLLDKHVRCHGADDTPSSKDMCLTSIAMALTTLVGLGLCDGITFDKNQASIYSQDDKRNFVVSAADHNIGFNECDDIHLFFNEPICYFEDCTNVVDADNDLCRECLLDGRVL